MSVQRSNLTKLGGFTSAGACCCSQSGQIRNPDVVLWILSIFWFDPSVQSLVSRVRAPGPLRSGLYIDLRVISLAVPKRPETATGNRPFFILFQLSPSVKADHTHDLPRPTPVYQVGLQYEQAEDESTSAQRFHGADHAVVGVEGGSVARQHTRASDFTRAVSTQSPCGSSEEGGLGGP